MSEHVRNPLSYLQSRYGEQFIKGERLEDGNYSGKGLRELFATELNAPHFIATITRLIPSKHQALATLRDNQDYIRQQLTSDIASTHDETPLNSDELSAEALARLAGYYLYGPFNDAAELEPFREDFKPDELLCTFDEASLRVRRSFVLWLRRHDADTTLHASDLTHATLNDSWRQYLKEIGRYNETTDTYNLTDLQPTRHDPYGTSSMSVQISRNDAYVTIKNRYNHTVDHPDSTFSANLDAIYPGLRAAIYTEVDRPDLLVRRPATLADGYCLDTQGGIHPYFMQRDGRYLGYFEYIENGEVTRIDPGIYDCLTPELYVTKHHARDYLHLSLHETLHHDALPDGTYSVTTKDIYTQEIRHRYEYSYAPNGAIEEVRLHAFCDEGRQDIAHIPHLTQVTLYPGSRQGDIHHNPKLTEIVIHSAAEVNDITHNPNLEAILVSHDTVIEDVADNQRLREIWASKRAAIGNIVANPALQKISFEAFGRCGQIAHNPALEQIQFGAHAQLEGNIFRNESLLEVCIGPESYLKHVTQNPQLRHVDLGHASVIEGISHNPSLTTCTVPATTFVNTLSLAPPLQR